MDGDGEATTVETIIIETMGIIIITIVIVIVIVIIITIVIQIHWVLKVIYSNHSQKFNRTNVVFFKVFVM